MFRGTFFPGTTFNVSSTPSRSRIVSSLERLPSSRAIDSGSSTLTQPLDPKLSLSSREWVPPQWSQPAVTILRVIYPPYYLSEDQQDQVSTDYVFDAVLRLIHRRTLRKTSHPILTGSNISDHAYLDPTRVSLEIGMSDAMAAYSESMWTNDASKSVAAWLKIKEIQQRKLIVTLVTRLDTYRNMMIVEAESTDDNTTRHGLRGRILLEELIPAVVQVFPAASARGMTVNESSVGTVQSTDPNPDQEAQHVLPPNPPPPVQRHADDIPGAGKVGSNSLWDIFVPPTYSWIP